MLILQKYLDCIRKLYKLRPENLDFKNHLEEARIQINAQIENKTKGRRYMPSSFSPPSFSPSSFFFQGYLPSVTCSGLKTFIQAVLRNVYHDTEHFLYPENFFHICSQAISDFILHHRLILPILKLQISEVLQDVLFCVFSFSMLFLRSFTYLDISVAHAFLFLRNIPLYEYTSLFTLFLLVGYLGHIQFWAIINNVTVNPFVKSFCILFFFFSFLLSKYLA